MEQTHVDGVRAVSQALKCEHFALAARNVSAWAYKSCDGRMKRVPVPYTGSEKVLSLVLRDGRCNLDDSRVSDLHRRQRYREASRVPGGRADTYQVPRYRPRPVCTNHELESICLATIIHMDRHARKWCVVPLDVSHSRIPANSRWRDGIKQQPPQILVIGMGPRFAVDIAYFELHGPVPVADLHLSIVACDGLELVEQARRLKSHLTRAFVKVERALVSGFSEAPQLLSKTS